ncbi:MAG: hypothetical protein ACTSSA_11990, partial [Candidatus Freyarchaeota archaeon]
VRRPPEQPRRAAQPETESHNQTHDNQKEAKKFNIVELFIFTKYSSIFGNYPSLDRKEYVMIIYLFFLLFVSPFVI